MIAPKLIVFDLDGTLIDSLQDLAVSVNIALERVACPLRTLEEVHTAIGHGALRLVVQCLPPKSSPELQEQTFAYFLEHYNQNCANLTLAYDGVVPVLAELQSRGIKMALLTNKPQVPSRKILEALGLDPYLTWVLGGDSLPVRKPDPAGLWWLMGAAQVLAHETLMVGDSIPDFSAAQNAGVQSVGYLSNLAMPQTWSPGPDHRIAHFVDLLGLLD